jgi:hypothetical protein
MSRPSVLDFDPDLQDAYERLPPTEQTYGHVKADVERRYFLLARSGCPLRFVWLDERGAYSIFPLTHAEAFLWGVHYFERDDARLWVKRKFHPRWVRDTDRRKVHGINFDPMGLQKGIHNLFRGFDASLLPAVAEAEVEGLCACVHAHVFQVLAGGDAWAAAALTDWLAGFFQRPGLMSKVAPVLIGGRANLFVSWVRLSLIGARYSTDVGDDPRCLVNRLFVHVDSRRAVEPTLELLIKSPVIMHRVGGDACDMRDVPNYINAFFTTASEHILYHATDRACFRVFLCSNALCGDVDYFDRLEERLADPRVQRAYYQSLMNRLL